ncbi:hypothetical protein IWQ62_002625 [Dispira parvispora]|uniref:SURP motif domain-containing protein n=1 Tax=Dispira parvispora TaxID=1520584 RepID=A0A9W8E704_9FUNG|nr:hypothetical protein IWQ62_002625 [Dispira parvispora]
MSTHLPRKRCSPSSTVSADDNIGVFGYACRIFPTPVQADDSGESNTNSTHCGLVPWLGGELVDNETVWLDRYDIRHLIEDPRELSKSGEPTKVPYRLESDYDAIRYLGLRSDPEVADREIKRPCRQDLSLNYHCQLAHDPMTLPETQRQVDVMYRTAKFLTTKDNQGEANTGMPLEAVIQAKQSHNPLFRFLHRGDSLHSFYQYLLAQCQAGLTWDEKPREAVLPPAVTLHSDTLGETRSPCASPENSHLVVYSDSGDSSGEDDEANSTKGAVTPKGVSTIPHESEGSSQAVGRGGSELETMILQRHAGDSKFDFLNPSNPYYPYYRDQVQRHTSPKDSVADSTRASLPDRMEKGHRRPCESSKVVTTILGNTSGPMNTQHSDQKKELVKVRQARVHLLAQRLRAQRQQQNDTN